MKDPDGEPQGLRECGGGLPRGLRVAALDVRDRLVRHPDLVRELALCQPSSFTSVAYRFSDGVHGRGSTSVVEACQDLPCRNAPVGDKAAPVDEADLLRRLRVAREPEALKELAHKLRISLQLLSFYELGKRPVPTRRLRTWLRLLDLPEEWADLHAQWKAEKKIEQLMAHELGLEDRERQAVLLVLRSFTRGRPERPAPPLSKRAASS